nr:MAG TPA: Exodeoxyribonuclease 8 [Caudoviricetes sp.]
MKIEIPYYEDNTRISNSAIGWFLKKGPRYLKDMLDGKEEGISAKYLDKGTMIHMYLLQPEEFWSNYMIIDYEKPKTAQQLAFCEAYFNSNEIVEEDKLINAYKASYSGNNMSKDAMLKKAKELQLKFTEYIEFLDKNQTYTVISFADLNMLKNIKKNIDSHIKANELLIDQPGVECHNEFHINWEAEKQGVSCKSLLDRVKIDHANKKITLIDLKTTVDVYNFKHSVEEYDYYRQIAFYILALTWYMKDEGYNIEDYDLEAYIVAIQSNSNNEVRVFNMLNEKELLARKDLIADALTEISYHYQTGNWDHTREYYENNGTETLK